MSIPPPPGFTSASSLVRETSAPITTTSPSPIPATTSTSVPQNPIPIAGSSNRNASNAHLPSPIASAANGSASTATTGALTNGGVAEGAVGGNAVAGPSVPRKPVNLPSGGGKRSIVVNACQRGNPILKLLTSISWEYGDIPSDYLLGQSTAALFLSLRYHRLHPEYLHGRIEKLRGMYLGRILLVLCDVNEHQEPIREITKICLINEMTVMIAWSNDEAALYLSTYKSFEHRGPELLKERVNQDYGSQLQSVLTGVRGVNKTDVMTLSTNFGSFKSLSKATPEQLSLCPGLGETKVRRLHDAFNLSFKVTPTSRAKVKARVAEKEKEKERSKGKGKASDDGVEKGQLTLREMEGEVGLSASEKQKRDSQRKEKEWNDVMIIDGEEEEESVEHDVEGEVDRNRNEHSTEITTNNRKRKEREPSPDWPEELPSDEEEEEQVDGDGNDAIKGSGKRARKAAAWKDPLASDSEGEEGEG